MASNGDDEADFCQRLDTEPFPLLDGLDRSEEIRKLIYTLASQMPD